MRFEVSKSTFGLHALMLMSLDWMIRWFLMSRPFKNILNTLVFIRFQTSDFFLNLVTLGSLCGVILDTLGGIWRSKSHILGAWDNAVFWWKRVQTLWGNAFSATLLENAIYPNGPWLYGSWRLNLVLRISQSWSPELPWSLRLHLPHEMFNQAVPRALTFNNPS